MNSHIELVKKWMADPESVSVEELEENKSQAYAAYADVGHAAYAAYAAVARAAADAVAYDEGCAVDAKYCKSWVEYYEELKKEPDA